jgi:hypothetical protein
MVMGEGHVALGEETSLAGSRVGFASLRYWAGFVMARDGGLVFLAAGSLLAALGLALRLAQPDQIVRALFTPIAGGTELRLTASTRFFPALFEDWVDELAARITRESA